MLPSRLTINDLSTQQLVLVTWLKHQKYSCSTWSVVGSSCLTVSAIGASLAHTLALSAGENWLGIVGTRSTLAGIKLVQVLQQGPPQVSPLCDSTWDAPNQIYDGEYLDNHQYKQHQLLIDLVFELQHLRHDIGARFNLALHHSRIVQNRLGPILVRISVWNGTLPLPGQSCCLSGSTSPYQRERLTRCLNVWAWKGERMEMRRSVLFSHSCKTWTVDFDKVKIVKFGKKPWYFSVILLSEHLDTLLCSV